MIVTTEIRIKDQDFSSYLDDRAQLESKIILYAYRELKNPDFYQIYETTSKFNTHLCKKFKILSRTANSIIKLVEGEILSYIRCKEFELENKKNQLGQVRIRLKKRKKEQKILKEKAANNTITQKQLKQLKRLNNTIYHLNNRINKLKQQIKKLKKILKNHEVHIAFGTKKMFKKQFNLEANNFSSHAEWKKAYEAKKSHMIYSVGRAQETSGNQIVNFKINPENGTLTLRFRKEQIKKGEPKYIYCHNLVLHYLKEEFYNLLKTPNSGAVTARFLKRGRKWYVQITFDLKTPPVSTSNKNGVISLDYNHKYIQQGELDRAANLVALKKYPLKFHGQGNRAKNEMNNKVNEIVLEARERKKSIALEDLSFIYLRNKYSRFSENSKRMNKIISILDYSRYIESISRCAQKNGVEIIKVPACYTTKNALEWLCPERKLTSHAGSCITIGRRGMNLSDFGKNQL